MIRGAIFDADGTLLDSMHIWREVGRRYLISKGKTPEKGLYNILFPMTLEESSVYLKKRYSLTETPQRIKADVLDIIDSFYRCEAELKPGAEELLRYLSRSGVKMIVASTGDSDQLNAAFTRLGVREYFEDILTCSELKTDKKQPTVYLTAAKKLGTAVHETAVFEDVLYAVQTAKRAGFVTVAVRDAESEKDREEIEKTADMYIDDLTDRRVFNI